MWQYNYRNYCCPFHQLFSDVQYVMYNDIVLYTENFLASVKFEASHEMVNRRHKSVSTQCFVWICPRVFTRSRINFPSRRPSLPANNAPRRRASTAWPYHVDALFSVSQLTCRRDRKHFTSSSRGRNRSGRARASPLFVLRTRVTTEVKLHGER